MCNRSQLPLGWGFQPAQLLAQLYPERAGYHRIDTSVTNLAWLNGIPGDTAVLIVAEGVVMYLHQKDGVALFRRITEQFPSGQIAFDGYSGVFLPLEKRGALARLTGVAAAGAACTSAARNDRISDAR